MGVYDAIIASTCMAYDLPLWTMLLFSIDLIRTGRDFLSNYLKISLYC
jgi:hypothetical protein